MFFKDVSKHRLGKSLKVIEVPSRFIDGLFEHDKQDIPDEINVYPNQPLVLKNGQQSCLARVHPYNQTITPVDNPDDNLGIRGRNKEQELLQCLLQDSRVRCVVITGQAGTGKTVISAAYALERMLEGQFEKIYLSKPLEIVTSSRYWGTVPGDEDAKFAPFLKSFEMVFKSLVGENGNSYIDTALGNNDIEFIPLELMRGATLRDCVFWFDEAQNLNNHEVETLGSRLDDEGDSELILSGDLNQIDKKGIDSENTGIRKLLSSKEFLNAPFTAHVNLIQNERGEVSQMFNDVFN